MTHSLEKLRLEASKAYYAGAPILSNEEYDALFGDTGEIGVHEGETLHLIPMYSLQKFYPEDGGSPPVEGDLVKTHKLDGAAISVVYFMGQFILALTRGDGTRGKDITANVIHLVPEKIPSNSLLQITGEVIARSNVSNPRNYASGALNLKNPEEFLSRVKEGGLVFAAYNIEFKNGENNLTYTQDLSYLYHVGFTTVLDIDTNEYPTDGIVYRVESNRLFRELGFTSKHPRGAYAEKTRDRPVLTKLVDVVWQTGKTGKVTPVAILEPVLIEDASISRATLNNMAYIEALGLEIGCTVKVIRAGKIIPCVVGRT